MEQHGENPKQKVIVIIPARYSSTRLPGKLLLDLAGKPLIIRTLEQAKKAKSVGRVIVAADDDRIIQAVVGAGGEAVMTSLDHASGSDRIAEVARLLPHDSIVVNVQGDEPLIAPETIDAVVEALVSDPDSEMATSCEVLRSSVDIFNPNIVKVVSGPSGHALYFSRSPIPFPRDAALEHSNDLSAAIENRPDLTNIFRKHTGIYAYRRDFLLRFTELPQTPLEKIEMLEQLRALEHGARIKVVETAAGSIGVDTQQDLDRARQILKAQSVRLREALPGDVSSIANVHVESWRRSFEGIAPDEYLKNLSVEKREKVFAGRLAENGYRLLAAESDEDGIIGFIDFGKPEFENFGYAGRIYSFYLLPEYQRRGVGTRLFRRCLDELRKEGYRSVCLDTLEMSPYRAFYEKSGGRVVARDKHNLGDKEFATIIYGWDEI